MWQYNCTPSSDELYHHGIMGMKWGKRNGPPYPLDSSQKSSAEKKVVKKISEHKEKKAEKKRIKSAYKEEYMSRRSTAGKVLSRITKSDDFYADVMYNMEVKGMTKTGKNYASQVSKVLAKDIAITSAVYAGGIFVEKMVLKKLL